MKIIPLTEIPFISFGDDLADLLMESLEKQGEELEKNDVFVVAQSIVSKAQGNIVHLSDIKPSEKAKKISKKVNEDPRKIEVILSQTKEIVRFEHVLISKTNQGFICADAGVDSSNVDADTVTTLPPNPDQSATEIRDKILKESGKQVAVIISDTWGRPFRKGAVGFSIGTAGIKPLWDLRGKKDAYGNELKSTVVCPPDSLAAAASLEMGEADEQIPAVLIKGANYKSGKGTISELFRPEKEDLFR